MNKATITLKITVSSDTILPGVLRNALSVFGGELTAQIYDHLRDDLPELVNSEDFQTDWLMRIRTPHPAQQARLSNSQFHYELAEKVSPLRPSLWPGVNSLSHLE